jgi:hypothetical protein
MVMTTRSMECSVSHAPVLTPSLLDRIEQLNLEYLQLLLDVPLGGLCAHLDAVPVALLQGLRKLSPAALQMATASPYALYTLGFEDQELWLAMLGVPAAPAGLQVADAAFNGCRLSRHTAFCESAIFFAWHLAVANPLAARMMCGMPATVIEALQTAKFGTLQSLMRGCPWLLTPRWPANSRFWPDLLKFATASDAQALHYIQLLGSQLIACDLRLAESLPSEQTGRLRATRSAQLQRWKLQLRT